VDKISATRRISVKTARKKSNLIGSLQYNSIDNSVGGLLFWATVCVIVLQCVLFVRQFYNSFRAVFCIRRELYSGDKRTC